MSLAQSLVALAVALCVAVALADTTFTYPKCGADTSKCCTLSADNKMAHHGYFLANLNGNATIVTCKNGELECHLGNPDKVSTTEKSTDIECPDFKSLFESRSGVEILEGVVASTTTSEDTASKPGQVKAASE